MMLIFGREEKQQLVFLLRQVGLPPMHRIKCLLFKSKHAYIFVIMMVMLLGKFSDMA